MSKKYEKTSMRWAIYGMSVASLLFILVATYLIVRIIDGQWASWQLPTILVIVFFVLVPVSAMWTSVPEVRKEINKDNDQ